MAAKHIFEEQQAPLEDSLVMRNSIFTNWWQSRSDSALSSFTCRIRISYEELVRSGSGASQKFQLGRFKAKLCDRRRNKFIELTLKVVFDYRR
jgi:hypothetical protein